MNQIIRVAVAVTAVGCLLTTGCSGSKEGASSDGQSVIDKTAEATGTAVESVAGAGEAAVGVAAGAANSAKDQIAAGGQAALQEALKPVFSLLEKSESDVQSGDVAAAATTMKGFAPVWEKASPVIQKLSGDSWEGINNAATTAISTFSMDNLNPEAAGEALQSLITPLKKLAGV